MKQMRTEEVTPAMTLARLASPLGVILLVTDAAGCIRALDFEEHEARMHRLLRRQNGDFPLRGGAAPRAAREALSHYFAGGLTALEGLPCALGGTVFQRRVWAALRMIRPGTSISYGELAARIGKSGAARAVGAANGANPISLIVPCHRVIGADGTLTGYGGGLKRKQWLLAHEADPQHHRQPG